MRFLKQAFLCSALAAAIGISTPAQAQLVYLGNFEGNECTGFSFSNCYATQTGVFEGPVTDPLASPSVFKFENDEQSGEVSTLFPSVTGAEFVIALADATNVLSFTYTPGVDDPALHYVSIKQSTGYALFYDDDPILAGSFDLDTYFPNNPGYSHITFYDTQNPIPEPATWAMMLIGFGAVGTSMRFRRRKSIPQAA